MMTGRREREEEYPLTPMKLIDELHATVSKSRKENSARCLHLDQ